MRLILVSISNRLDISLKWVNQTILSLHLTVCSLVRSQQIELLNIVLLRLCFNSSALFMFCSFFFLFCFIPIRCMNLRPSTHVYRFIWIGLCLSQSNPFSRNLSDILSVFSFTVLLSFTGISNHFNLFGILQELFVLIPLPTVGFIFPLFLLLKPDTCWMCVWCNE